MLNAESLPADWRAVWRLSHSLGVHICMVYHRCGFCTGWENKKGKGCQQGHLGTGSLKSLLEDTPASHRSGSSTRWVSRIPQLLWHGSGCSAWFLLTACHHSAQDGLLSAGGGGMGGTAAQGQAGHNLVYKKALTVTVSDECSETSGEHKCREKRNT